jgi:tRNA pseudouridine38-40 synthase
VRRLRLTIAYDGSAYSGWQVQPARPTVQASLEAALQKITGESIRTLASGRTDAGVHALGQVVGFRTTSSLEADTLVRALNANLPEDIVVYEAVEVADNFHPIGDAIKKRYRYLLHDGPIRPLFLRRYCWHVRRRLAVESMLEASQSFLGRHDFSSFETLGAPRADSIRTITDLVVRRLDSSESPLDSGPIFGQLDLGGLIAIEVEADGFLYNMVRAIVGTLVEVGRDAESVEWVEELLSAQDRSKAGPTAPPEGLFMVRVDY